MLRSYYKKILEIVNKKVFLLILFSIIVSLFYVKFTLDLQKKSLPYNAKAKISNIDAEPSNCVSKIGYTSTAAVAVGTPGWEVNVGIYPGPLQDKMRSMMDCAFPTQNWSSTLLGARLPEIGNPNNNYPYRPYDFIYKSDTEGADADLYPAVNPSDHLKYTYLVLNEPGSDDPPSRFTMEPLNAAIFFVQVTNKMAGVDKNSSPLTQDKIEKMYCCGNHSQVYPGKDIDIKWMNQFLCHLNGEQRCQNWKGGADVTTQAPLSGSGGGYMKYLAGYHWHIYHGHPTAKDWGYRLNDIYNAIDAFHTKYPVLPIKVLISETAAPQEKYWGTDNIYDKIKILFDRRNDSKLEGITWFSNFMFNDVNGSGSSVQGSLYNCSNCSDTSIPEGAKSVKLTNSGLYFYSCVHNNGTCPDPKTYIPPPEINAKVKVVNLSGEAGSTFKASKSTNVKITTEAVGPGIWKKFISYRYKNPTTNEVTNVQTCPAGDCVITPDATKTGWKIIITTDLQQTDSQDSTLRHICNKGSSSSGQWLIARGTSSPVTGVPYNNPNSTCINSLYDEYTVEPVGVSACPTITLAVSSPIQSTDGTWVVSSTNPLASFPINKIPIDQTTGFPASGWSRVSKKINSTSYQVVCSSSYIVTVNSGLNRVIKGNIAPSLVPNQCKLTLATGESSKEFRVESLFKNAGANGTDLQCNSSNFVLKR